MTELIIDVACWVVVFTVPLGILSCIVFRWYRNGA